MGAGDFTFQFRWVPTLLLALPIPLFVALGLWQLERADQKRTLSATLDARGEMAPVRISGAIGDPEALRYRRLEVRGNYVQERQFLIEGRRLGGRAGFHVITPLRVADGGGLLLVNRGWIAATPGGEATDAPVPAGEVRLTGEADIPSPPALVLHQGPEAAREWGGRWPYLTLDLFAATVDELVLPVSLLLAPEVPGGFERQWTRPPPNPGMHLGYAGQWFGFAVIALFVYLRLSVTRTPGAVSTTGVRP
jgi:surfeit locus 1 family protein